MLTTEQKTAAEEMRRVRPPVIPGTNVVMDDKLREVWHRQVTDSMISRRVMTPSDIAEFCNIAGVPE